MKRTSFVGLLSTTILVATAGPTLSEALTSNPMPNAQLVRVMALDDSISAPFDGSEGISIRLAQADFDPEGDEIEPPDEIGPRDMPYGPRSPALHLAFRVAVAETYVGITSGQLDAWRAYTAALIELFDVPKPDYGADETSPERPEDQSLAEDVPPQSAYAPLFTERLADRAIERGEKANTLKTAAAALRTTLAPKQIAKLREVERFFMPPFGPFGSEESDDDWAVRRHGWHPDVPASLLLLRGE